MKNAWVKGLLAALVAGVPTVIVALETNVSKGWAAAIAAAGTALLGIGLTYVENNSPSFARFTGAAK